MNRQIKFRVWDNQYKKWFTEWEGGESNLHSFSFNFKFHWRYCDQGGDYTEERYVIQQYTGLKDKNNREIYEGDIVKQQFDYNDDPQRIPDVRWSDSKWEVVWCDYEHRFGLKQLRPRFGSATVEHIHHGSQSKDIEVVGNIFENPELQ